MAEEEVVVAHATSPAPADHKRKLEDIEPEAPPQLDAPPDGSNVEPDDGVQAADEIASDSSETKRPRLDGKADGLEARENGSRAEHSEEHHEEEKQEETKDSNEENNETGDVKPPAEEIQEPVKTKEVETKTVDKEGHSTDDHRTEDNQQPSVEASSEANNVEEPAKEETKEVNDEIPQQGIDETGSTTRKIEIQSSKVGVLIGKGGDTIRYLQYNSGAKIQILRDAEADPVSSTRPVEIIGTLTSIEKAEKLIHAVIAEADAGGSPSLVARGLATTQAAGGAEQVEMQVPNDKVGLIIGRGGETIKNMQTKSGARIQLIPQHQEGNGSKERTVRVSGDKKQIEMATEMIKDVMNQTIRPSSLSAGFNQPAYRPRGPSGPPQWGPRGPHAVQPMPCDYHHHHHHRGPYPSQSSHYNPPSYGSYPPQHMPPRNSFGGGWDQRPPHSGGYDYYGRQGSQISAPHSTPGSGHAPTVGLPPSQANYNYGQHHGPDYGHAASHSHTPLQQTYGHMYEQQPKYDNLPPAQQPYGGHGGSQPSYPHAGGQQGYGQPQPHGKPYGVQGPNPQAYGPPKAATPGDMPYQSVAPPAQSYVPNVATTQQQYPYASSGALHQSYPSYGSAAPPSDGYNQQAPSGGYGQVAPGGGYGSYPSSQQGYTEQPTQNSGSYGYQASQDPTYGGGSGSAYAAAPSGQPVYEQSATQSAGYATAAASAPVNSLSPQPGYAQYDANQVYAAPR